MCGWKYNYCTTTIRIEMNNESEKPMAVMEEPYWQVSHKTNKQKWSYMFEKELFTDMELEIGENLEIIKCHRIVLAMHSPVIETMFSERWGQENCFKLQLPDFDEIVCRIVLKFLYTEVLDMSMVPGEPDFQVLLDNCLSILRFSSLYCIPVLAENCHGWLLSARGIFNEERVLQVYSHAVLYSDKELEKISLNLICSKSIEVFNSSSFLQLSHVNLCRLLELNDLSIPEFDLFEAVCRWAEAECYRQDQDVTPENMRMVLKGTLHLIRFPAISPDVFATRVGPTGLLTLEERVEVLTYMSLNDEQKQKVDKIQNFGTRPRSYICTLQRFQNVDATTFDYSNNWRRMLFQVNHPIKIVRLGFYGPGMPEDFCNVTTYTVKLTFSDPADIVILSFSTNIIVEPNQKIFHVDLPEPLNVAPNFDYMGPKTWMGDEIRDQISMQTEHGGEIVFKFREAQFKNNRYQIPEICFTVSR